MLVRLSPFEENLNPVNFEFRFDHGGYIDGSLTFKGDVNILNASDVSWYDFDLVYAICMRHIRSIPKWYFNRYENP